MNLHASSFSAPFLVVTVITLVSALACTGGPGRDRHDAVARHDFNRAAVRLNLPLLWVAGGDQDSAVSPAEVVSLLFYGDERRWVVDGRFTPEFEEAYDHIVKEAAQPGGSEDGLDVA